MADSSIPNKLEVPTEEEVAKDIQNPAGIPNSVSTNDNGGGAGESLSLMEEAARVSCVD